MKIIPWCSIQKTWREPPEQIASRNAAAKKSYHLNHHANLKRRFMQRVASGKTTRIGKASMDKFGMTMEEVNDIRRCNGLGDLRSPLEPPPPCRLPAGDNGANTARASDPAQAPDSGNNNEAGPSGHASSQAQDAPDVAVDYVLKRIWDAVGAQQLDKDLQLQFRHGKPLTLRRGTVKSYHDKVRQLYKDLGCKKGAADCLKDTPKFLRYVLDKYKNKNSTKSYICAVYSFGKYIPEFRAALGPAFKVIYEAMMAESFQSNLETIARTGTARVVPFKEPLSGESWSGMRTTATFLMPRRMSRSRVLRPMKPS